jgi:hypothetical protein
VVSDEAPVLRASQYWNLLSVDVQREDGTSSRVTGAVFGNEPHIVQVRTAVIFAPSLLLRMNSSPVSN